MREMRQTKTVPLLIALAFAVFLVVMITSSLGDSPAGSHVMPNGQTMDSGSMDK